MMTTFKGKQIYQAQGSEHPLLIFENKHCRWLTFGSKNIQSAQDLQDPEVLVLDYMQTMINVFLFKPVPKHILIAGLGGGALVRYCQKHTRAALSIIDIEPKLAQICKTFFSTDLTWCDCYYTDILQALAAKTIARADIIFCDVFSAKHMPNSTEQAHYFETLRQQLTTRGCLVINLLEADPKKLSQALMRVRHGFKNQTLLVKVPDYDNIVVFAFNHKESLRKVQETMQASSSASLHWDLNLGLIGAF